MGETTHQIRTEIEYTRERLGHDLDELQHKVRHEADPRVHIRRHPYVFGVAAVLLALVAAAAVRRMLA